MKMKRTPFKDAIRDDNLRLIFAPVEARLIDERMLDLRAGAVLLGIFSAAVWLFTWAAVSANGFTLPGHLAGPMLFAVWMATLAVSAAAPLIAAVLGVEYAKVLRRRRDHADLLRRYGRA